MKTLISLLQASLAEKLALVGIAAAVSVAGAAGGMAAGIPGLVVAAALTASIAAALLFLLPMLKKAPATGGTAPPEPEPEPIPLTGDRVDELTGLATETGMYAWFAERGKRIAEDGRGIIVLSADLADFERIERTYGKKISDQVLVEVARRVATCSGSDGVAARTGGDDFAAVATIVPQKTEEATEDAAGKLAELLQRPVELPGNVVWIGGSVGASYGEISQAKQVLEEARIALKRATRLGRGHYVLFKPDMKK